MKLSLMYDPAYVQPMRDELTAAGFKELKTPEEVDATVPASKGTLLCMVNSICGCAAGSARPGVLHSLRNSKHPSALTTVFAGQDREATERARSYFVGYAPSSPSVALFKDGKIVYMLERRDIEGFTAEDISRKLTDAYDKHC